MTAAAVRQHRQRPHRTDPHRATRQARRRSARRRVRLPRTRLYLIATHSGITLAPLLGRLVAEEVVDGERSPLLADYAPDRLIGKSITDFPKFATLHFPAQQ